MEEEVSKNKSQEVYHERQRLQFCLLRTLNDLFQEKDAFTRAQLNLIAEKLQLEDPNKGPRTPLSVIFKPRHNVLTGNYDINVLIAALEKKGRRVIWHDRRSGASSLDLDEQEDKLMGIVLNIPFRKYSGLWRGKRWVALRKIEGFWYNLDSDLATPCSFQDTEEVREYLDAIIGGGEEVLLVMNDER